MALPRQLKPIPLSANGTAKRRRNTLRIEKGLVSVTVDDDQTPETNETSEKKETMLDSDNNETSNSAIGKVNSALNGLTVLEFEVISALFPISGAPEPYQIIAQKLGLTIEEVIEIEENALRDLRGTRRGLRRIGAPWN